jgi:cytosine/adenosine deaminase-related metal-dependent hydrolase
VFPVDSPPIADGWITIADDRVVAIGHASPPAAAVDLGNVAILPGLVNAHTHLEFSDLQQPLGALGIAFPDWIRAVIELRRQGQRDVPASSSMGLQESLRAGVAALGEIATSGWSNAVFDASPLHATVFLECINLLGDFNGTKLSEMAAQVATWLAARRTNWTVGLSPHAPYTVHQELFTKLVQLAIDYHIPLAFHLAESEPELELLRSASGPFRKLLEDLEVWDESAIRPGSRPLEYLKILAAAPRSLVIHGNYLDSDEIAFLADHAKRMSVVYCPRTHAYFRHEPHPLPRLLAAGASVALGTDSRATNPDLSLFEEMRYVAQHHNLPLATALEIGTLAGARALGIESDYGSLHPGKLARLAIVELGDHDAADPHELLFDATAIATLSIAAAGPITGSS